MKPLWKMNTTELSEYEIWCKKTSLAAEQYTFTTKDNKISISITKDLSENRLVFYHFLTSYACCCYELSMSNESLKDFVDFVYKYLEKNNGK